MSGRRILAGIVLVVLCTWTAGAERTQNGTLELTIVTASSREITPARIGLLDQRKQSFVPKEALRVAGDCGWLPIHNWIPGVASWQMRRHLRTEVWNPYAGTLQFYTSGTLRARIPAGRYTVRVEKGMEYRAAAREIHIDWGRTTSTTIPVERWIDLGSDGWISADDHLHIARPSRRFDRMIATWMAAEDLRIANLLQMGLAHSIHITPQYAFGKPSVFEPGNVILASGQENPRTHFLGHAITLGALRWIDHPKSYLAYDRFWREARRQGAINGLAHWGVGGADEAMALWVPDRLLDFLEIFGFDLPYYDTWYELLNLGMRMTPTAGTDYPCSPSLPGRERFYARVDKPLTYAKWLESVRRGRTFITNGPAIEFRVSGLDVGSELRLDAPGTVEVEGAVRFDPERDNVEIVEVVRAGEVIFSTAERITPDEIRFRIRVPMAESTWMALRATGKKIGETPVDYGSLKGALGHVRRPSNAEILRRIPDGPGPRPSAAHTAPTYVTIAGTPSISEQPAASRAARAWLVRLDELEALLDEKRLPELAGFPGRGDGVTLHDLRSGRSDLLRDIAEAREAYRQWQSTRPASP
jgi:hypothetical protein